MKCLTICQPYAELICLADSDRRAKRVENRTWPTSYRGPLLIHAGKSREWLVGGDYGLAEDQLRFGAIVGVAELVDCFCFDVESSYRSALGRHSWLARHAHVEGPYCFVLAKVYRFREPIEYRGAQGLFEIDVASVPGLEAELEAVSVREAGG